MKKPNFYTVQLKLKRHKLAVLEMENEDAIQIGGIVNLTSRIIVSILLPTSIGLTLIISGFIMKIGSLEAIGAVPLIYAGYAMAVLKSKKVNNKNVKIIRTGELEVKSNSGITIFKKDAIKNFNTKIHLVSKEIYEGKLLFSDTNNNQHVILSINDTEKKVLEDDLIYLKEFIINRMNNKC